ncbi:unnamed protein product [Dicrocoelium dendriticum]|nr:unnamed protein product [Dicrocoelium dendriticum]
MSDVGGVVSAEQRTQRIRQRKKNLLKHFRRCLRHPSLHSEMSKLDILVEQQDLTEQGPVLSGDKESAIATKKDRTSRFSWKTTYE